MFCRPARFNSIEQVTQFRSAGCATAEPAKPVQEKRKQGLGDLVESALTKIGITSERVEEWLGRPCNCPARKQKLNRLGEWANSVLSGNTETAAAQIDEMTSG